MGSVLAGLTKFIGTITTGGKLTSIFSKTLGGLTSVLGGVTQGILAVSAVLVGKLIGGLASVANALTGTIASHLSFVTSLSGMLDMAEEARSNFSSMADSMAFYSSSTGSTTKAMGMLYTAASKSLIGIESLKNAFQSMVDAGADNDKFIQDMLPTLGDFEVKTGVAATNFATMSTKFQQMFGEKKGITKDIKDLQKALIGTGLKSAQLESTMQGLTEAAEKLGFATQGSTMDIKGLANSYGKTTAVFKAFGVSAQTTTSFLNGLVDPENVEKNMLLMNKMGISYQEYNEMLNSGKGQDKFFDKVLNNVGKVAQEANMIQDASTRFKYLKDTLGLPPEIANKLMKVTPSRMQSELRRIKKEMDEAEKKDKWRKDLKAREEKYEEAMKFLKMQMVAPLISIVQKNRGAVMKFMQALGPAITKLVTKVSEFLGPIMDQFLSFANELSNAKDGDFMKIIGSGIGKIFKSVGTGLRAIWEDPQVREVFTSIGTSIMDALGGFFDSLFGKLWENIKVGLITGLLAAVALAFAPITAPFAGVIVGVGALIAAFGGFKFWEAFGEQIKTSWNSLLEWLYPVWKTLKWIGGILWPVIKWIGIIGGALTGGLIAGALAIAFAPILLAIAKFAAAVALFGTLARMFSAGGSEEDDKKAEELTKDKKLKKDSELMRKASMGELKNEIMGAKGNLKVDGAFAGSEKQIDDIIDALKSGDQEGVKNNVAELRKELLKAGNKVEDVDNYIAKIVDMTHETDKAVKSVEGVTEGVKDQIKGNKEALEKTKELANEKLSDAEVSAAVQKLMADQGFMAAISSSLLTNKDKKIGELEKSVKDITEREKGLREEFEKLKSESVPGILKQWEGFLFGEQEDSLKNILMDIRDQGMDEVKARKNNSRVSSMVNTRNSDIAVLNQNMASSSITGYQSQITKAASDSKIKSLPVKQTMYLKAIADSTYDAAKILNYIGKNLMFTDKGLVTTSNIGSQTGKVYGMDGKEAETGKLVSGFNVV